ncbi:hypothetical protein [Luteibacter sp. RCC_6_2]|uniref:hypothetical protein n=1 Tax=Luteibacter sp. RCC_6_2 TaxID=3239223 RepID=UPI0035239267
MVCAIRHAAFAWIIGAALPVPAAATSLAELSGNWALHIDGKAMIVLRLEGSAAKPAGEMVQPKGMSVTNGLFSVADNAPDSHSLSRFVDKGDYALVTFRDATGKTTDFELRPESGRVEVGIAGVPSGVGLGPWIFDRAGAREIVANDWQPGRSYVLGDSDVPSAEMAGLYREDQEARQKSSIDWSAVSSGDALRRKRTRELIVNGSLHTGSDYKEAAFVMQHGTTSDDFLLAHSLALVAMAKGESSAAWIAAATLDRFLWSKGLPQIYGTQSKDDGKGGKTSQPFNDRLVDDHLRQQLGATSTNKQ